MSFKETIKKIEPFIALALLLTLIILAILLYQNNKLEEEIAENCGYERGEDVYCWCEKSEAMRFKNLNDGGIEIEGIELDG